MSPPLPAEVGCESHERIVLLLVFIALLRNNNMATNLQRFTLYTVAGVLLHETVERRHLGR